MTITRPCRQLTGHACVVVARRDHSLRPNPVPPQPGINPAPPVALPPLRGGRAEEISALAQRVQAVFAMDDSASMYGAFGDPTGIRYAAAQSLVALQQQSGGGRAAVLHWGTACPEEQTTPMLDVRQHGRRIRQALRIPPTLGGNDMPAALRRAADLLPPLRGSDIPLVFVITDGIEDVTPETHAAVGALPDSSVHLLLVDRSYGCSREMKRAWRTVPFGSFTPLPHFDTALMAMALAKVYARSLGLSLARARTTRWRRR